MEDDPAAAAVAITAGAEFERALQAFAGFSSDCDTNSNLEQELARGAERSGKECTPDPTEPAGAAEAAAAAESRCVGDEGVGAFVFATRTIANPQLRSTRSTSVSHARMAGHPPSACRSTPPQAPPYASSCTMLKHSPSGRCAKCGR